MTDMLYPLMLVLNMLWFGAGFWYFALKHKTAAKLLVPKSARSSPLFSTLSAALPFLGGMNFAFSLLSAMLLANLDFFTAPLEQMILLIALGTAHASQFLINVPVAKQGGRIGESYWNVMKGPMLFIFIVDAELALLNFFVVGVLAVGG